MIDYFELFELNDEYIIDNRKLEEYYIDAITKNHPDLYKDPSERSDALEKSMIINNAYKVLKNPKLRLEYMLHKKFGIKIDDIKPDQEILSYVFDVEEHLQQYGKPPESVKQIYDKNIYTFSMAYKNGSKSESIASAIRILYLLKFVDG